MKPERLTPRSLFSTRGVDSAGKRARRRGEPTTPMAIRPGFAGGAAKTCQWIENDDPANPNYCGDPARADSSWCEAPPARCYRPAGRVEL